jgi:hypothetical protein
MTKGKLRGLILAAGFLLAAIPALAHHSFTAEFNIDNVVTIKGTLTKVDWINPHIYFFVDVKDDKGNVTNWAIEGHPTGFMRRAGVTSDMFVEGQTVVVEGWHAKDGTKPLMAMKSVLFQDGRKVYTTAQEQ